MLWPWRQRAEPHPTPGEIIAGPPARRGLRWRYVIRQSLLGTLLSLLLLLGLRSLLNPVLLLLTEGIYRQDFLAAYVLARAIAAGENPYLPIQALASQYIRDMPWPVFDHPTPHPPTLGMLLWPLAQLDYVDAARLWFAIEFAALVGAIYLIGRVVGSALSLLASIAIAIALVTWPPVSLELATGQVQLVMLGLVAGALLAFQHRRPVLAGGALGLTLLLKPLLVPVLFLLLIRRCWQALGAALAVAGIGYGAAVLVIGLPAAVAYGSQVLPEVNAIYRLSAFNISLWSLLSPRLVDPDGLRFLDTAPPVTPLELLGAAVAPLAAFLWGLFLTTRSRSLPWAISTMMCISAVVSPIAWSFYLVLAILPMGQVLRWLTQRRWPFWESSAAAVVMIVLLIPHGLWLTAAFRLAGRGWPAASEGMVLLPLGPGLLGFGPALGMLMLAWLTARLGRSGLATEGVSHD